MALTATQQRDLYKLAVGMYSAAPGTVYINELANALNAGMTMTAIYNALANSASFQSLAFAYTSASTNTQFATKFIENLTGTTLSTSAKAEAIAFVEFQLTNGKTRGEAMQITIDALDAVSSTDATFGKAAAQFDNRITVAIDYTEVKSGSETDVSKLQQVVGGVTDDPNTVTTAINNPPVTAGETVALTTGADNVTGTSGNDAINGSVVYDSTEIVTTASTLTVADQIAGGGGTDTLNITISGAQNDPVALPVASVSGVEVFNIRNTVNQEVTLDVANFPGITALNSDRSIGAVTATNLATGASAGIIGNGAVVNAALTFGYSTATDAATLNVSGGTKGGAVTITSTPAAVTVNSTGAANTIGAVALGNSATGLTVNATTDLKTGNITGFTGTSAKITVSGAAKSVNLGTIEAATVKTIDASGLTAGGITATLNAVATGTVTGGGGNDKLTTGGTLTTGTVDAGAGTDTLVVAATGHIDATAGKQYKNFETLQVSDGVTVDVSNLSSGNTFTALKLTGGAVTVNNVTATMAGAVTITAANASPTIAIKDATLTGQIDTLKITADDGDTTANTTINIDAPVFAGVENIELTISSGDTFNINALTGAPAMGSLKLQGAGTYTITSGALALVPNTAVDGSTATGNITLNFAAATANAFSFTGGSKVDTVTYGVTGGNVISTGAGNDVVNATDATGGTSSNQVTLGAGADTFNFGAAEGESVQDRVTFKFAAGDSVSNSASVTDTANADTITSIAWDDGNNAANGQRFTIDTEVSATAFTVSTAAVVFGTTTTVNAFDFYIQRGAASTDVFVYQDTDGDKLIEAGEFMVKLVGDANFVANNDNDFSISSGNLVFIAADNA